MKDNLRVPRNLLILWVFAFAIRLLGLGAGVAFVVEMLEAADARGLYLPIARSFAEGSGYRLYGDADGATRAAPLLPIWLSLLSAGPVPNCPSGCRGYSTPPSGRPGSWDCSS